MVCYIFWGEWVEAVRQANLIIATLALVIKSHEMVRGKVSEMVRGKVSEKVRKGEREDE